jgi:hypothetical protein
MNDLHQLMSRDKALDPIDLIPQFAFWREACRTMATNVCMALTLAEEEITEEKILEFISTLPRSFYYLERKTWQEGYSSECFEKIANSTDPDKKKVAAPLLNFFLYYLPSRSDACRSMLADAFIGIFRGFEDAAKELEKGNKSCHSD